jgi:hypothetical protein
MIEASGDRAYLLIKLFIAHFGQQYGAAEFSQSTVAESVETSVSVFPVKIFNSFRFSGCNPMIKSVNFTV